MEFILTRTSYWGDENVTEESLREMILDSGRKDIENRYNTRVIDKGESKVLLIDLPLSSDIIELSKLLRQQLIISSNNIIEIYDDWRE